MAEKRAITFQEALDAGRIKENDYFLVRYSERKDKLFRLVKQENGYVMWGPPTEKKVTFAGKEGYDNLFTLADNAVKDEYDFPKLFEEVHACGLTEKEYKVYSYQELCKILENATRIYGYPDDKSMVYALTSRCVYYYGDFLFRLFYVSGGTVYAGTLYNSSNGTSSISFAVRPEAIPKFTMCLELKGHDGSKENPWICICNQSNIQEDKTEGHMETNETISNAELIEIIQQGYTVMQKVNKDIQEMQEILAKLEKYAKNLK